MKKTIRILSVVIFALFLVAGCAPSVALKMPVPARYNYGSIDKLVLVEMNGKRANREIVYESLLEQCNNFEWWSLEDRIDKDIRVVIKGTKAYVEPVKPAVDELFMRVDVYDLNVDTRQYKEKVKIKVKEAKNNPGTDKGNGKKEGHKKKVQYIEVLRKYYVADVSLTITLITANGTPLMTEREYSARAKLIADDYERDDAKVAAVRNAVRSLYHDITPRFVRQSVRLDDEAKDMLPVIKLVKSRAYDIAEEKLIRMKEAEPTRADVVYNLAVVTEATGDLDKAYEYYTQALRLGAKPYYARSRENCAKRKSASEALSN